MDNLPVGKIVPLPTHEPERIEVHVSAQVWTTKLPRVNGLYWAWDGKLVWGLEVVGGGSDAAVWEGDETVLLSQYAKYQKVTHWQGPLTKPAPPANLR